MTETRDAHSRGFDFRVVNQAVITEYRATGGKLEKTLAGSRLLLLTTIGERTGQPHTTPLGYVTDEDQRLVVYASNMAAAAHPQWYRNLLAQPKVTVELGAERFDAQASTATGAERERLYTALVEGMPGLRTHQDQTTREIPVVVLVPVR
ncbi:deazaflavin-dependent oxidoreductase, nitroreductase family [Frankia sp. EI5c]|uniref:nitroreductase family deazaflavin-dependent oxidoreductase n=1 Tax=Frankia sp. EI5c TaxID=683316 RepID=UPI0007C3B215|nr:nitroreductase family deazaflavin-dependent oxidoreductase [Frankia sp. EI5c]OAA28650.1 deazaflavin-dependent oxidoreductase, nitroreductase family [Frankia sp. EI5c]